MSAIRIRKTIESDTLTLPELKPFIGRTVEIVIEEPAVTEETKKEFWDYAAKLPSTKADFESQHEQFQKWRQELRFEAHWPLIDEILIRDFEHTRKWAAAARAVQHLDDYDYDAIREQGEYDLKHANDHLQ